MSTLRTALLLALLPALAHAAPAQLQLDGGLSVAGPGYEHPLSRHVSLQGEVFVFGTYFLPWFDVGDDTQGVGAGARLTYFENEDGHGLYLTPYVRGARIGTSLFANDGDAVTIGAFVGWAWGLTDTLDLRVGGGVQYMNGELEDGSRRFSTGFLALDATLGYRL